MTTDPTLASRRTESRVPTLDRRTLVRGAAWSVPAVALATAAPAYASSAVDCAVDHTFDWSAFVGNTNAAGHPPAVALNAQSASWTTSSTPTLVGGTLATGATLAASQITFATQAVTGGLNSSTSMNGNIPNGHFRFTSLGQPASNGFGVPGAALKFSTYSSNATVPEMTITLTFGGTAVEYLDFILTDIDSNRSNQTDRVWIEEISHLGSSVQATNYTLTTPASGATYNTGATGRTQATAWIGSSSASDTSTSGNLRFQAAEGTKIDKLVLRFANVHNATGTRSNSLNIGNITYQTTEKVCAA